VGREGASHQGLWCDLPMAERAEEVSRTSTPGALVRSVCSLGSNQWSQALCLTVLTVSVYWPALQGVARADQLIYLYQTRQIHGLWPLISETYALNRVGPVIGDAVLFRPVLYCVMAVERYLWGADFELWQLTSLALHTAVVLSLFVYFRFACVKAGQRDSSWPFVLALFFAMLYAGVEMVVWHHLAGYLLFCALAVGALLAYQHMVSGSMRAAVVLVLFVGLSCFTYELGNVLAVLIGVAVLVTAPKSHGGRRAGYFATATLLVCLPVTYFAWSYGDYATRHLPLAIGEPINVMSIAADLAISARFWTASALTPGAIQLMAGLRTGGGRITAGPFAIFTTKGMLGVFLSIFISILCVFLWAKGRHILRDKWPPVVAAGACVAYAGIIVLGREISRGVWPELWGNSYYVYMFALFGIVAVFHWCLLPTMSARQPDIRQCSRFLGYALATVALIGATQITQVLAAMRAEYDLPFRRAYASIETVRATGGYTLSADCPTAFRAPWLAPYLVDMAVPRDGYTVFTPLFPEQATSTTKPRTIACE